MYVYNITLQVYLLSTVIRITYRTMHLYVHQVLRAKTGIILQVSVSAIDESEHAYKCIYIYIYAVRTCVKMF